jgi:hypothetical protein
MDTRWLFLVIVAFEDHKCSHLDIKNIFTQFELKEQISFQPLPRVKIWPGDDFQA